MGIGSAVLDGRVIGSAVLGGQSAASGGYSVNATQFFNRITDPGTTRKDLYAALIDGLTTDGIWAKLDALWILAADIAGNAIVNLKSSSFTITVVSTPTFTTDRGYSAGSATKYLDTGYNLSSAGGVFVQDDAHISVWNRTSRGSALEYAMGANGNGTNPYTHFILQFAGTLYPRINSDTGGTSVANADAQGHYIAERTGVNAMEAYRNGASIITGVDASHALPNLNMYILGVNETGGNAVLPTTDEVASASIGSSLGNTLANALYSRLQTYMTAVGA